MTSAASPVPTWKPRSPESAASVSHLQPFPFSAHPPALARSLCPVPPCQVYLDG